MDDVALHFQEEVLDYVVDKAVEFKLGARGLRSIVETIIMDEMYESPSRKSNQLTITLEMAKAKIEKANLTRFASE
jgi:ATP-dependent Clp protease ATP-binding subunit ClpX